MGNIIGNLFGNTANKSADETMAISSMSAASMAAAAYLTAALDSVTPEVRRLFSEYCTQSLLSQEMISGLSLKKGWISPYDVPLKQLQTSLQQSQSVLSTQ